ncbi:MAG: precorrin-2/cobalt-factor-2 C20-methyltransferase [Thermoanaerobacter sp.]|nr:precorrin-2/cobalt-factor-2 C20-methyltransferase [Thermoanaerobacter sp.]
MPGKFYGIGVGPGDPELLTLKAYRALEQVDVLCVPKSAADRDSLALAVVEKAVPKKYELLELDFPMSKDPEVLKKCWKEAGQAVAGQVLAGRLVAFVTIGDPMLYSTYGYVLRYLKENHPGLDTETIPGVTAFSACASLTGVPLVEGDETLAVVPAAYDLERLRQALEKYDNVVVMKVNRRFPEVLALLKELGLAGKAVYISRCGYEDQYFTRDLDSLPGSRLDYMSLLIVRKRGI